MTSSARWGWIVALVAGTGAALVLAFVLSFSSQGGGFYERHFVWLFWLNVAAAVLLALVIAVVGLRLLLRLRRGKFGSRLLLKLAGIFAVVGLLPGLVIYTVSYQFVSRSIEAWFDVKVAGALDSGLALGKETLAALANDLRGKALVAAERLAEGPAVSPLVLERLRVQIGAGTAALLAANGQVLLSAGGDAGAGPPERPGALLLGQARAAGSASVVESLDEETLAAGTQGPRVRALASVPRSSITLSAGDERFVMLEQPVPRVLAASALAVAKFRLTQRYEKAIAALDRLESQSEAASDGGAGSATPCAMSMAFLAMPPNSTLARVFMVSTAASNPASPRTNRSCR